jgi:hypothetical protein
MILRAVIFHCKIHIDLNFFYWSSVFLLSNVLPYVAGAMVTSEFRSPNTNEQQIFLLHRVMFYASFLDSDDVSFAEIEKVKKMIRLLNFYQGRLTDVRTLSEDELCTICYAYPVSATFRPCNHQSCRYGTYDCFMSQLPYRILVFCIQCASSMCIRLPYWVRRLLSEFLLLSM